MIDEPLDDRTSAYPDDMPSLLKKPVALAGDHGVVPPTLTEALKRSPIQLQTVPGDVDQRSILRRVAGQD